jgi:ankyrin repeat protein
LILAASVGEFSIVEALINNVPRLNLNKGDKFKRSPILMACRNGHSNIVALLMKNHADPSIPDTSMNQPIHHAAAYGWIECVMTLLKYKKEDEDVSPSAENAWKVTPITIALQKNHSLIVKELLLTEDINVNAKDDDGRTLLSLAVGNINADSVDLIESLLNQKISADLNT